MRLAIAAAAILLAACSADAQQIRRYDFYIYNPSGGPDVYAVEGGGRMAAVEVRGCGDASLAPDPAATIARMHALRAREGMNVVTVIGEGSRTYIGRCSPDDFAGDGSDESMVVIQGANAAQTRRTIRTLEAAPSSVREEMIAALHLSQRAPRE